MVLIDAHCHLDRLPKYSLPDGLLPVTVGYSHSSNLKALEAAQKFGVPYVLGIAPQTAIKEDLSKLDEWVDFIRGTRPCAIGEIGLDYHWAQSELDIQKEQIVFERMLNLADELGLPVVIHARKATHDVLDVLQLRNFNKGFMLHFFSGELRDAKRAADMGGYVSIPPVRSSGRTAAIGALPLERLLVETDAPYVGRTPEAVMDSVEYIAEVKKVDRDIVIEKTAKNARAFFRLL